MSQQVSPVGDPASAPLKHYSLRSSLYFLVAACVLPAALVFAYLAHSNYQLEKAKIYGETILLAQKVSAEIDLELSSIEAALNVLATAESLRKGDLRNFHRVARDALRSQTIYNYVLLDKGERQLVNTLRPFGAPLPAKGNPAELSEVFRTGNTALSNIFVGPVTKSHLLAMAVPVFREDEVIYALSIGLSPKRLAEIVARHPPKDGWLIAVLDRTGTIVARSRDAERFVGEQAVPELVAAIRESERGSLESMTKDNIPVATSFVRSPTWGWSVVIGAPKANLEGSLYRLLAGILLAALTLFAIGAWIAGILTNRVIASVKQLNDAALALGNGQPVNLPDIQLDEAEAVGQAMLQAARLMDEVKHRAYHDGLTGLANRAFFYELLHHQIAAAQREGAILAVLAIDLDNFKLVNDEAGHPAGDTLLKIASERINETIRASDVAARMGGDEFSILLWNADFDDASETANRLRDALRQPYPGITTNVSASIGIAIYPLAGRTLEALLENADRALYKAKHAGKNGCAHYIGPGQ
ncbi:MAG: GGDEF domain-containing protein [Azonexaceae bacterium]|nr:GGDEF domain-containing protein [Azonexaceae bacterium]